METHTEKTTAWVVAVENLAEFTAASTAAILDIRTSAQPGYWLVDPDIMGEEN